VVAVQTIVLYDVPSDSLRTKIATICLDYGLQRIQYSAFMGPMSRNRQEEVFQKITRRIGKREANVRLFGICDKDIQLCKQHVVLDRMVGATPGAAATGDGISTRGVVVVEGVGEAEDDSND